MKHVDCGPIDFLGLVTVILVFLKVIGVISWSWLWVFTPLWSPLAAALLLILVWVVIR